MRFLLLMFSLYLHLTFTGCKSKSENGIPSLALAGADTLSTYWIYQENYSGFFAAEVEDTIWRGYPQLDKDTSNGYFSLVIGRLQVPMDISRRTEVGRLIIDLPAMNGKIPIGVLDCTALRLARSVEISGTSADSHFYLADCKVYPSKIEVVSYDPDKKVVHIYADIYLERLSKDVNSRLIHLKKVEIFTKAIKAKKIPYCG